MRTLDERTAEIRHLEQTIGSMKGRRKGYTCLSISLENDMNLPRYLGLLCCIVLLQGCFDSPDKQSTKENTDGSRSSIQMDKPADSSQSK